MCIIHKLTTSMAFSPPANVPCEMCYAVFEVCGGGWVGEEGLTAIVLLRILFDILVRALLDIVTAVLLNVWIVIFVGASAGHR